MIIDNLLIAIILAGTGLSCAYLRAELVLHRRITAAERRSELERRELHTRLWAGLAALSLVSVSTAAAAGDVPLTQLLAPGMRVRILAPDISAGKVVGTVDLVSDDSVTLAVPGRNEPVSILRQKIARLDESVGRRSRGVDAGIGAAIGAGIGAAGCALSGGSGHGHIVSSGEAAGVCALLGAGVGALVGAAIPPGERWQEISATRYRLSFAPRLDHGLNLAAVWQF